MIEMRGHLHKRKWNVFFVVVVVVRAFVPQVIISMDVGSADESATSNGTGHKGALCLSMSLAPLSGWCLLLL